MHDQERGTFMSGNYRVVPDCRLEPGNVSAVGMARSGLLVEIAQVMILGTSLSHVSSSR